MMLCWMMRPTTYASPACAHTQGCSAASVADAILRRFGPTGLTELGKMLGAAFAAHRVLVRDCQQGLGNERHLRALMRVAQVRRSDRRASRRRASG